MDAHEPAAAELRALYLDVLKKALTRSISSFGYYPVASRKDTWPYYPSKLVHWLLARRGWIAMAKARPDDPKVAEVETMAGLDGLGNIQRCLDDVLVRGVPGDLLEAGVWRGGSCIFMRGVLKAYGDTTRTV